jgi:hypothetical protein
MQQVITQSQARAVLNGRAPLIPVEYETACKALAECITLDEAKYWDNKADALAAWAKIYHSTDAERKAKQLKLHAFRRMGEISRELRPVSKPKCSPGPNGQNRFLGGTPGPVSMMRESGLTKHQAVQANLLAKMPEKEFSALVTSAKVPSPASVQRFKIRGGAELEAIRLPIYGLFAQCRKQNAADAAAMVPKGGAKAMRDRALVIIEWLDEFERRLPKDAK